jgi:hypothetical protein
MFRLALNGRKLHDAADIPMLKENNVRRGFFEREQFEAVRGRAPLRSDGDGGPQGGGDPPAIRHRR